MKVQSFSFRSQGVPVPKRIRFCNLRVELEDIVHWVFSPFRRVGCGRLQLNLSMNRLMRTPPVVTREEVSWVELNPDVLQLIFAKLPEASVLRAGSVCRKWHSVTQEASFIRYYRQSYCSCKRFVFSVGGTKYSFAADQEHGNRDRQAGDFSFQPIEDCCPIPAHNCPDGNEIPSFHSAGGLHHAITAAGPLGKVKTVLRYKNCVLDKDWKVTPSIPCPLQDPIVGAPKSSDSTENGTSSSNKLILVSGVPFESLGENDDEVSLSIYDEKTDSWATCEPLPSQFRGSCTSDFMASVVHKGRFYAYDMYSGLVSLLDLESKKWSFVKSLRPSAAPSKLFLVSRPEGLFVVGVQDSSIRDLRFNVWNIIDESGERIRIGQLVRSSIIRNARPPPASVFTRWKSWSLEALSSLVALMLFFIIKLILLVRDWKSKATSFLHKLLNSIKVDGRATSSHLTLEGRSAPLLYRTNRWRR